jgi:hypothetical protein
VELIPTSYSGSKLLMGMHVQTPKDKGRHQSVV